MTKQTELTFSLQKYKTQLITSDEKYKQEIMKLESIISSLTDESILIKKGSQIDKEIPQDRDHKRSSNRSKIALLYQNFRELKSRKEEAENSLKEYEVKSYQKQIINQNESNYISDLKKKCENTEKFANLLSLDLKSKEKDFEEVQKSFEILKRENKTLKDQIKLFTESESDPANHLLQSQLIACEHDIQYLKNELKDERLKNLKESEAFISKIKELSTELKESEAKFSDQISQLLIEKELLQQNQIFNDKGASTASFKQSAQDENFKETLQLTIIEKNDLKLKVQTLSEKIKNFEQKTAKYKKKIESLREDKEKLQKNNKDYQEKIKISDSKLNTYELKIYEIADLYNKAIINSNELETEITNLKESGVQLL